LLRADLQTRYNAHKVGIEAGFLTRNEARSYEDLPTLPGLDEPLSPLNMGSGNSTGQAGALAHRLAANCMTHEAKLLGEKPRATVYGQLLPGYIQSKCGLTTTQAQEYCSHRLAQPDATEADGVQLLASLILGRQDKQF
jgi:hypothetical protein